MIFFFSLYSHDSNPYIPDIAGMDEFQGRKIHSKWFRFEEHFDRLKVAVLGCHFSGQDISMLVAKFAKKVKDILDTCNRLRYGYSVYICLNIQNYIRNISEQ